MLDRTQSLKAKRLPLLAAVALSAATGLSAQTGRFDLLGPKVDVHVTRGDRSLPIASVPNLQPGDKLQVHADLPSTQAVHLLLVVAFLRGATNPPPDKWFTRFETWKDRTHNEGITVTVPQEAQQALIFIAPETGGDFSTLKSAVRGRPGTFVRASQDLNEASFEQSRIERYVQAIKQVPSGSPAELLDHSHKLAATLQLKTNDDCFKRSPDLQAACLSQSGSALLLDDGHGQTMAQMLSTGPTSDLIGAVAGTPMATVGGAAAYSAYVGTVLDVVRLLTGLHTATYQYIPAIAFPDEDALNLRLNTAPSFHKPESVIVIALPAVQKAVTPPLQLQDAHHVSCLLQPHMVLPLNGAPLVFATGFAHDLTLHLNDPGPDGRTDLPLVPDAYEGGLMVSDTASRKPLGMVAPEARADGIANQAPPNPAPSAKPAQTTASTVPHAETQTHTPSLTTGSIQSTGVVRGYWGFDAFEGPTLALQRRPGEDWTAIPQGDLFIGRSGTVALHSSGTACVASVELAGGNAPQRLDWHQQESGPTPNVEVKLPLEKAAPGTLKLAVRQYDGALNPQTTEMVPLTAYADAVHAVDMLAHAGDRSVLLRGTGLGGIQSASLNGVMLTPVGERPSDEETLRLESAGGSQVKPLLFKAGDHATAQVTLSDGRTVPVPFHVEGARPSVTLLSASAQRTTDTGLPVTLGDPHDLPLDSKITLALRSESPSRFPRTEKVEVALADGSLSTTLSLQDRTLVLQDSKTALGYVSPSATFGPSAFGDLQLRAVAGDGTFSDWLPLGTLVRTPVIRQLTCSARATVGTARQAPSTMPVPPPAKPEEIQATPAGDTGLETPSTAIPATTPCILEGSNLFLVEAVSGAPAFTTAVELAAGYAAETLQVPRPVDGRTLYLRLRDDPAHIASVAFDPSKQAKTATRP